MPKNKQEDWKQKPTVLAIPLKILDLYCGVGGSAVGIKEAIPNADIIGVDINYQQDYPFDFIRADAIAFLENNGLQQFDFIWASPPCQAYSWGTIKWRNKGKKYPDLISITREALLKSGKPFVIENVIGSPLRRDLMLCGEIIEKNEYERNKGLCDKCYLEW